MLIELADGQAVRGLGVQIDPSSGISTRSIDASPSKPLTGQLFYVYRSSYDGSLKVRLLDPGRITVGGRPLTPEERRLVWQTQMAVALEEHIHVVQALRQYAGMSSTDANVSQWAQRHRGSMIDDEADAYVRNLEWLGRLDFELRRSYESRRTVPLSLAGSVRPK